MKSPLHPASFSLSTGLHRPIYLWGGPGTIRMNRVKFMSAPVDEQTHLQAHELSTAVQLAQQAGFNWAYLMYDWGFPPEIEQEDWQDFTLAVQAYHTAGVRVFGYIQASNCVFTGSYRDKDWYAQDLHGKPFHYYTGRYMTCWSHPEWKVHLEEMLRGVLEAQADGVFFDNPWHGCQPLHLAGAWMGPAGCYCQRCREAFKRQTGLEIPEMIDPSQDKVSVRYLKWRTEQVTDLLNDLAMKARLYKPDIVISVNDFDAVMRPSHIIYGIDLRKLAQIQDIIMIEDYGLPRWESGERDNGKSVLINNALTLRIARSLCGNTPISTDPYDQGIGFDGVYPTRRFQQGLAEAAACRAMMVVKGTEYVEQRTFTLLTAPQFTVQREGIRRYHAWLLEHANLYQGQCSAARIGLLYPQKAMWQDWDKIAPLYFGASITLLANNIPWRVIQPEDDLSELDILLDFNSESPATIPAGLRLIRVPELPGWQPPSPSLLARRPGLRKITASLIGELFQAYFKHRWTRWLYDSLGMVRLFTQSPYFQLPNPRKKQSLLEAVGDPPFPRVTSKDPVLVESFRSESSQREMQLHLVNYATQPQKVEVQFNVSIHGRAISPDGDSVELAGEHFNLELNIYSVLCYSIR